MTTFSGTGNAARAYNVGMVTEAQFCRLLGISPGASTEEVRRAYRKAALRYHPDRCPDPGAASVFHQITEAYRATMKSRRSRNGRPASPQELAMRDWDKPLAGYVVAESRDMSWLRRLGGRKFVLPTRNENFTFVCCWAAAVGLTVLAILLMGRYYLGDRTWQSLSTLEVVVFAAVPLAMYAAAVATTIAAIVLTRRIVWLAAQIRLACARALPGPGKNPRLPG